MKGRWSKSFQLQQERFYRSQHRPPSFTGKQVGARKARKDVSIVDEEVWNLAVDGANTRNELFSAGLVLERCVDAVGLCVATLPHLLNLVENC